MYLVQSIELDVIFMQILADVSELLEVMDYKQIKILMLFSYKCYCDINVE